jgi:hypothetical protein
MVNDMLVANGTTRARLKRRKKQRCRRACCDKERERAARGLSVYDSCAVTGTAAAHAIRSLSAPLSSSPRARRLRFHVPIYLIYVYAFSYMKREWQRSNSLVEK